MRVEHFFIANYAETTGGLVSALGAFPEWWRVPSLPNRSRLGFVALLRLDPVEVEQEFDLVVSMQSIDTAHVGLARLRAKRSGEVVPDAPIYHPVTFGLEVEFTQEGAHTFTISEAPPSAGDPMRDLLSTRGAVRGTVAIAVRLVPTEPLP